jgi:hypothetical protein
MGLPPAMHMMICKPALAEGEEAVSKPYSPVSPVN